MCVTFSSVMGMSLQVAQLAVSPVKIKSYEGSLEWGVGVEFIQIDLATLPSQKVCSMHLYGKK